MEARVIYSLLFSKMIFKAFLYEIIPICAAAQQAILLAALKHSWTEGAFAEIYSCVQPGCLSCFSMEASGPQLLLPSELLVQ